MTTLAAALRSSVGKKYLMGISGLIWFGFAIGHLIGNFLLFSGKEAFNSYAHFLVTVGHGKLVYVAEFALILALVTHIWNGFQVAVVDKQMARPDGYEVNGSAGGPSRKGHASQTMIVTGIFLLLFLFFHIATFKYDILGPKAEWLVPNTNEKSVDLYMWVVKWFGEPVYAGLYVFAMACLGTHLSHGLWSALQSLGLLNPRTYPVAVAGGTIVAIFLALGFVALPITICLLNAKFATGNGGLL